MNTLVPPPAMQASSLHTASDNMNAGQQLSNVSESGLASWHVVPIPGSAQAKTSRAMLLAKIDRLPQSGEAKLVTLPNELIQATLAFFRADESDISNLALVCAYLYDSVVFYSQLDFKKSKDETEAMKQQIGQINLSELDEDVSIQKIEAILTGVADPDSRPRSRSERDEIRLAVVALISQFTLNSGIGDRVFKKLIEVAQTCERADAKKKGLRMLSEGRIRLPAILLLLDAAQAIVPQTRAIATLRNTFEASEDEQNAMEYILEMAIGACDERKMDAIKELWDLFVESSEIPSEKWLPAVNSFLEIAQTLVPGEEIVSSMKKSIDDAVVDENDHLLALCNLVDALIGEEESAEKAIVDLGNVLPYLDENDRPAFFNNIVQLAMPIESDVIRARIMDELQPVSSLLRADPGIFSSSVASRAL